jgi:transcriptional regulator with XRE-family HTH domain
VIKDSDIEASDGATAPPEMTIANELIKARTEKGFSQARLAEIAGVSRSAIKGYETGKNMPGARELRALCLALKVTPNLLLFGSEVPALNENEGSEAIRLLLSEPENRVVARSRLGHLVSLLTEEEEAALLVLVRGLSLARHGSKVVERTILASDLAVSALRLIPAAKPGESMRGSLDNFLARHGHSSSKEET